MKLLKAVIVAFLFLPMVISGAPNSNSKPKLVVGVVVDQMRYDFLTRFRPYFGKSGFNRLINEGSNFTYAHFNYVPTHTAPGHSSIYTGTTPYYHGIIDNYYYDRHTKKVIYCCTDNSTQSVGSNDDNGKRSPKNLLTTTITDQLKISNNGRSKVIAISIKDRASILPGGHLADAAYWYNLRTGSFISSTYYLKQLPKWVTDFNNKKLADEYSKKTWQLAMPIKDYKISMPDNVPYETDVFNEGKTTFPHSLKNIADSLKYEKLISTPYGNQILLEFAKAALANEHLGQHDFTDFLAISFSSPDYIGHAYGPNSMEIEDMYIRLDQQIADLLNALDKQVGKGNYIFFLTADHGAMEASGYLKEHKIPSGELNYERSSDSLKAFSLRTYGDNLIENYSGRQLFLNYQLINSQALKASHVRRAFANYLRLTFPAIAEVWVKDDLEKLVPGRANPNLVLNGFNFSRSGDIAFELQPNYLVNIKVTGTTHGARYEYDTHVPLLFYGWHIQKERINDPVYIVDIAATVADLLGIDAPDACMGIPLIKNK